MLRISILSLVSVNLYLGLVHYFPAIRYLWLLPLTIYAASFFLAITKNQIINHNVLLTAKPFFVLPLLVPLTLHIPANFYSYTLYSIVFFFLGLLCHNEIVTERKNHGNVVSFALFIGLGLVAGAGIALMLPKLGLFQGFPLAVSIMLLSFFLPQPSIMLLSEVKKPANLWQDMLLPLMLFIILAGLRLMYPHLPAALVPVLGALPDLWTVLYCIVAPAICFTFRNEPLRFGFGVSAIVVSALVFSGDYIPYRTGAALFGIEFTNELATLICAVALFAFLRSPVIFKQKTVHGFIQIEHNLRNNTLELNNDKVVQGSQSLDADKRLEPLSYYSRKGPLGQLFEAIPAGRHMEQIAAIGLGVGTIAIYGKEDQCITFYEINPLIDSIARDRKYFTYLSKSVAKINTIIGDARQSIEKAPAHYYDMIICDAYVGGAIPKHLITREAIELYSDKLKQHGLLVFDITNQSVNLIPILGKLAQHAGLAGIYQHHAPRELDLAVKQVKGLNFARKISSDTNVPRIAEKWSRMAQRALTACGLTHIKDNPNNVSIWVVLAHEQVDLAFLTVDTRWRPLTAPSDTELWTDTLWNYDSFKHTYTR